MDIEISNPINIKFELIEVDDHLPSMKFNVSIIVKKFSYSSEVHSKVWIECHTFDDFMSGLGQGGVACLKDINNSFELILNPIVKSLEWSCIKEDCNGGMVSLKGCERLDDDSKASIYKAFNDYPKWW
ncbi:hypothetical protein [Aeromonas simiae]|uniref:hypothetical protein n=1 Tax=Aeromonas simiae TaxID=218936 RepID=UPI0012EEA72E|nr:hypothetical protein [Aeromonas simiae]MDO2949114.1 hypothetical protein [Aeromonas simiae]MDO2956291.1 hypothetical protein [Aeromonas simiae]